MSIDPLVGDSRRASRPPQGSRPAPSTPRRRTILIAGALIVSGGVVAGIVLGGEGSADPEATSVTAATPIAAPATPPTTAPSIDVPGSLWWIVNGERPLPAGYVPADLVTPDVPIDPQASSIQLSAPASAAFEAMVADAATAGFRLQLNSGYRSQEAQQELYDRSVDDYGEEVARQRVALPGTSEHQTGLSVDVGEVGLPLDQVFGDTAASQWVQDNAHRFGFIVRYPPDKAAITGYANEPWHLRYVGTELASTLHASGLTMEEYFHLPPAGGSG
jgi:zinc D-Ala-D-Ala carboxypeptidase